MPALETFVLVVSVVVLLVLSALTALTQLDPEGVAVLRWLQGVSRWFVPEEKFSEPYGPRGPGRRARRTQRKRERLAALKENPHLAASTQNETETSSSQEDAVSLLIDRLSVSRARSDVHGELQAVLFVVALIMQMESAFQLYEQRLSENRRREKQMLCVQLQNIKAHTLEFPCSGSVLHPTPLLAFSNYYSTSRDSHLCVPCLSVCNRDQN